MVTRIKIIWVFVIGVIGRVKGEIVMIVVVILMGKGPNRVGERVKGSIWR